MMSVSEMAEEYERWAAQVDAIIIGITSSAEEYPDRARDVTSLLAEEARLFRERAARLRAHIAADPSGITMSAGGHA